MFFLGISAHLFIYLLLPAFLVVYFYFKGVSGDPKVNPLLSETVVYREADPRVAETNGCYQVLLQQENKQHTKKRIYTEEVFSFDLPVYLFQFTSSPIIKHQALRAPPCF